MPTPSDEAKGIALNVARDFAEQFGHMLASDLLAEAQRRNPGVGLRFVGAGPVKLEVRTRRGTVLEERGPYERWHETFRRLGLL